MRGPVSRLALAAALAAVLAVGASWARASDLYGPGSDANGSLTLGRTNAARAQDVINILDAPYNVSASASDNTAGLQAAVNAAVAANKPLSIPVAPNGACYKYTPPLNVNGNLTVVGDGVTENWQGGIDSPNGTPGLYGSVLCPASNGSDAIDVNGTSLTLNIRNLGILFQTLYTGTGDGIHYIPPTTNSVTAQGLSGSLWENVKVMGHDGNHYAYNITNPIVNTMVDAYSYGGGAFNIYGSAGTLHYGNLVMVHPYGQLYQSGTADCMRLDDGGSLDLNLVTMIRPQCSLKPSATSSQRVFYAGPQVLKLSVQSPDFESTVSGAKVIWPYNTTNTLDLEQTILGGSVIFVPSNAPNKQGFLPSGQLAACGSYSGSTSGSFTFEQPFPNGIYSVVLTGWGHTAQLNAAPTTTGFSYTQSAAGTSYYCAYGY